MRPPLRLRRDRPPVEVSQRIQLEDIIARLRLHGRAVDEAFLRSVLEFAVEKHGDQKRRSGELFYHHPLYVAYLLADLGFDEMCVAVGLLHDVLEDTRVDRQELGTRFDEELAELVDGVTKIGRHEYVRRGDAQAETFRKLILASARDVRVIVVKLADRLHNMMTLEHLAEGSRRRIARETLEIYAPLAHRLGMSRVQGDLEDLAFYHLHRDEFRSLVAKIEERRRVGRGALDAIREELTGTLGAAGIEAEIGYRIKRPYSIYRKLKKRGIEIEQLYDYLAFRIITGGQADCYAALGLVHTHPAWRAVPGRFKDYIANPKPNGYRSLHTTVLNTDGRTFEVQIRTKDMDREAEEGIAAHWRYKAGRGGSGDDGTQEIRWLRQLVDWQKDVQDPRSFLSFLKIDLYPDEVYAFTPRGDVMSFPRGATPLDFAYKVHTEVGHHCQGARLNGKLVPLRTPLGNGDMVEILTNPSRHPSRDWLSFVVTSRAKSKIRHWLNTQQNEQAIEIGRRALERELGRFRLQVKGVEKQLETYVKEEGLGRLEELFARVGFGRVAARQVVGRVLTEEQMGSGSRSSFSQVVRKILPTGGPSPIEVRGHDDLMAFLAKCCSPLPGEAIVGYITRGRGVSVHSQDCPNVRNLLYHPEREIEVRWASPKDEVFPVSLEIETEDKPGMLARLTEVIAKNGGNIRQIGAETETGRGVILVVLEVRNRRQLQRLKQRLEAVSGVIGVDRKMSGGRAGNAG